MYVFYNPNPFHNNNGDCVIRAIGKVTGQSWDDTYLDLCDKGFEMKDMPSSNKVWSSYLKSKGFKKHIIPNYCPDCYSIKEFCKDNPVGRFVVHVDGHVVAIENGNYFDTYDSGNEVPIYYFSEV